MTSVLAIARDQLADLRHRRVVLALLIGAAAFGLILCLLLYGASALTQRTSLLKELRPEDRAQFAIAANMTTYMLQTAVYAILFLLGAVLSLATFCGLVSSERARGSLPWVLSKPVTQTQFLLGKWLGACAMTLIYAVVISLPILGASWVADKSLPSRVCWACVAMPFAFLLLGSVGAFLATVMPPAVAGVLAYFAGAQLFHRIADWLAPWPWLDTLFSALYYVAPSYDKFNFYFDLLMGKEVPLARVLLLAAYALAYSAVMFLLSTHALRRRDLV